MAELEFRMDGSNHRLTLSIIDEEHRGIERQVVHLMEEILLGAGAAKVLEAASEALRLTLVHFQHEEAILEAAGYEMLKQHKEEHAKIMELVTRVREQLKHKESVAALKLVREFRRMLLLHLQNEDERYRDVVNRYAAEQGISPLRARIRHVIPEK
ncbi:MAG TPA: hemerythrin family protein [Candidatus Acidoferrales bacterium]|nr:hemerythrin family protein [Candidatus Acidoferrales bacterium]